MLHALDDSAVNGVLAVQEAVVREVDEELAVRGVRVCRTRRADSATVVGQLGELSRQVRHVGAACASQTDVEIFFHVAVRNVAGLRHETVNHAVKANVVIGTGPGQFFHARAVQGGHVGQKLDDNGATFETGGMDYSFFNSVGDLRGRKGSCYEGGLRVPCIVRYPGKVAANTRNDTPSYFPDWFPTLTKLAGANTADSAHDGIDLRYILAGKPAPKRSEPMIWEFCEYGGIIAIREGPWKAIRRNTLKPNPKAWELYDIEADPSEKRNLAKQHPERVQQLEAAWLATRTRNETFRQPLVD